ncbi:hypothetical protein [Rhodococcus artemisiae]|uniref:Uncharacterized protein n=1 Tax=Rhodococcus artemisiae TaxID=714159 RepID=A0ABU7LEP0_9NOCA|nr:hypothetical protein [Rhodococcus artemisiae]MEE2060013.1 hypothetical protein [Rhodococcus artemisiae]
MAAWIKVVLLVFGGYTAAVVLGAPTVDTYPMATGFGPAPVMASAIAASATGAVVAVLVAAGIRQRTRVAAAVLAGALLVVVVALPGAWRFDMYISVIGAGSLLGGLAVMCIDPRRARLQAVLAAAVVAGLLTAAPIAEFRDFASTPRRYADYLEVSFQPVPVNAVWLIPGVVTLVAGASMWVIGRGDAALFGERRGSRRELLVGIGIPVVGTGLHWSFERAVMSSSAEAPEAGRWLLGVVAVVVVIAAALWLCEHTGTVLLAAMALAVVGREAVSWSPTVWPLLLVPVVLAGVGAWLGHRFPRALVGIGVLALVAASGVADGLPWDDMRIAANLFVVPLAAAYTIAASLPSTPPVVATSMTLPAALALPLVAQYGWTAYTPLTSEPVEWLSNSWTWMSSAVSVAAVVALGGAMAWIQYRRPTDVRRRT